MITLLVCVLLCVNLCAHGEGERWQSMHHYITLSFELQATDMVAWYSYYNIFPETGSEHCNTWKALEAEYVVYYNT